MSSMMLSVGGESQDKTKPEYVSSAYDPVYDKETDDEEALDGKNKTTSNHHQHNDRHQIKIKEEDVKAEDTDTDDDEYGELLDDSYIYICVNIVLLMSILTTDLIHLNLHMLYSEE